MAKSLNVELVTPERLLVSADAEMMVVPGVEGEFGVLPGHVPVVSLLKDGVANLYNNKTIDRRFFVIGGFAEVSGERCTLLAEEAFDLDDTDRQAIQDRVTALKDELDDLKYKKKPERIITEAEERIASYEQLLLTL